MKKIIAINLTSTGRIAGGASIAAKFHSLFISKNLNEFELWRMWDEDSIQVEEGLKIRNFKSKFIIDKLRKILPQKLVKLFLRSNIIKNLEIEKPKIVHIHNVIPALEFYRIIRFCKRSEIYVIVSTHGFYEIFNPNHNFNFLESLIWKYFITYPIKKSLDLVDKFVTSYPDEKIFLRSLNIKSSSISLIPNGINPIYEKKSCKLDIKRIIKKFKLEINKPLLFFTGNHNPNKGIDTVIKIARKLQTEATIVIGGRCFSKNEPDFYLKDFNSQYIRVIFTDFLTNREQRAFYDIATLLLFPSKSDTSPLTVIESMARGLPVVAFNIGGIKYLLGNNSGFLVNNFDFNQFFNYVNDNLINSSNLNLKSFNSKKRQKELFNWKRSSRDTIKLYESILENVKE